MSRNYKIYNPRFVPYFISFATVYWIDIFIRERYNEFIVDSLNYCVKEKGLVIFGWCLMTSHIHLLAKSEKEVLQDIIRDFKKYTSRQMIKLIKENPQESRREWLLELFLKAGNINSNNKKYQLWQQHNKPIEIRGTEMMLQKITYIHKNPVVSRVVNREEDYIYSSSCDYSGVKGKVEIELFSL